MFRRATILIVDREKILLDLLVHALKIAGLPVFGATTTEQAQELAGQHPPGLVIFDPSVSGSLGLLEVLRVADSSIQIVALTGSEEMRRSAEAAGLKTILDKSQGLEALVNAIQDLLRSDRPDLAGEEKGTRILITDDEPEIRGVIGEFLKVRDYVILHAKNGLEAYERVQQDPSIRLVLMDVSMPIMGGIEALTMIMSRNPHPSVIMMTGVADREVARRALNAGAFDYILKPIDFTALDTAITACLSHLDYGKKPWWKRLTRN